MKQYIHIGVPPVVIWTWWSLRQKRLSVWVWSRQKVQPQMSILFFTTAVIKCPHRCAQNCWCRIIRSEIQSDIHRARYSIALFNWQRPLCEHIGGMQHREGVISIFKIVKIRVFSNIFAGWIQRSKKPIKVENFRNLDSMVKFKSLHVCKKSNWHDFHFSQEAWQISF